MKKHLFSILFLVFCLTISIVLTPAPKALASTLGLVTRNPLTLTCAGKNSSLPQNLKGIVEDTYCCNAANGQGQDCIEDHLATFGSLCKLFEAQAKMVTSINHFCPPGPNSSWPMDAEGYCGEYDSTPSLPSNPSPDQLNWLRASLDGRIQGLLHYMNQISDGLNAELSAKQAQGCN